MFIFRGSTGSSLTSGAAEGDREREGSPSSSGVGVVGLGGALSSLCGVPVAAGGVAIEGAASGTGVGTAGVGVDEAPDTFCRYACTKAVSSASEKA